MTNTVTVVSPDTVLLSEYMCQEGTSGAPGYDCWPPTDPLGSCPAPQQVPSDTISVWRFTSGPYGSGQEVLLDFETGVSGATGQMRIKDNFPVWTVEFEDGFDSDFDDFVLTVTAYGPPFVSLTADTATLKPWIRRTTMQGQDGTIWEVVERPPEVASLLVSTNLGLDEVVTLEAFWLPDSGGHDHVGDTLPFDSIPTVVSALSAFTTGAVGRPVSGFFVRGTDSLASVVDTTDQAGSVSVDFVAGFAGGEVLIVAEADTLVDTLAITVSESDLTDLSSSASTDAYFVGGTSAHPQGTNWYVTPSFGDAVALLVEGMAGTPSGWYPQVNDASLSHGGTFTISPIDFSNPNKKHRSHAQGIDVDLSFCMAQTNGVDPLQSSRQHYDTATKSCPVGTPELDREDVLRLAEFLGLRVIQEKNHYHLRPKSALSIFEGSEEEE